MVVGSFFNSEKKKKSKNIPEERKMETNLIKEKRDRIIQNKN